MTKKEQTDLKCETENQAKEPLPDIPRRDRSGGFGRGRHLRGLLIRGATGRMDTMGHSISYVATPQVRVREEGIRHPLLQHERYAHFASYGQAHCLRSYPAPGVRASVSLPFLPSRSAGRLLLLRSLKNKGLIVETAHPLPEGLEQTLSAGRAPWHQPLPLPG